ncbi:hypothetical protein TrLO_g11468 [Triparma laevis f. longispina]|uniref:Uncharacterized protein n=1 Tax=Triparma laevis f. longispina TaxID=1714387 RepID=A0A9W7F5Z3_9STRA|nr:hypothetical protein TrLO_g11468 [Triparma laevis f. longispina]
MSAKKAAARRRERILAAKKERMSVVDPDNQLASEYLDDDSPAPTTTASSSLVDDDVNVDSVKDSVKGLSISDATTRDTDDLLDAAFDEVLSSPTPAPAPAPKPSSIPIFPDPDDDESSSPPPPTSTVPVVSDPDDDDDEDEDDEDSTPTGRVPIVTDPDDDLTEEEKERLKTEKMKRYRAARFKKKKNAKTEVEESADDSAIVVETKVIEEVEEVELVESISDVKSTSTSTKRKFKGIAAMRREKAKEKAAAQAAAAPTTQTVTKPKKKKSPKGTKTRKTVEFLLTFLLLSSGYILGYQSLQQSHASVTGIVYADMNGEHTDYGGRSLYEDIEGEDDDVAKRKLKETLNKKPLGVDSDSDYTLPEQDDSDALTKIFNLGYGIIMKIISLPMSFIPRCIPTFLFIALIIRSSSFLMLGFSGIEPEKEDAESGDIIGMVMNAVKGMFPKVFIVYNLYQTVVGDILCVLFGLLWGVATFDVVGGRHGGVVLDLLGVGGGEGGVSGGEL